MFVPAGSWALIAAANVAVSALVPAAVNDTVVEFTKLELPAADSLMVNVLVPDVNVPEPITLLVVIVGPAESLSKIVKSAIAGFASNVLYFT